MDVGSSDKSVNTGILRSLHRLQGALDIARLRARQTHHPWTSDFLADSPDRIKIALRRRRKSGFDDVDAEFFQLPRDDDFLLRGHTGAGGLLTVSQRRVKNLYYVIVDFLFHWRSPLGRCPLTLPANKNSRGRASGSNC